MDWATTVLVDIYMWVRVATLAPVLKSTLGWGDVGLPFLPVYLVTISCFKLGLHLGSHSEAEWHIWCAYFASHGVEDCFGKSMVVD